MPQRQGLGHLTLTVTGLERSADFYNRLLGSQTAMASEDHLGPFIVCMGRVSWSACANGSTDEP